MAAGTSQLLTGILTAFLVGAGIGVAWPHLSGESPSTSPAATPSDHALHDAHDHDSMVAASMEGHDHGAMMEDQSIDEYGESGISHTPPFALESGSRPTLEQAKEFTKKYSRFIAKGDEGIDKLRAEGYLQGDGTPSSPYVLEKFYVTGELSITSISRSLILRDGYVGGQLKLNYIGESLYVHHVYASDLRVNENVERTGANTGGLFHDNHFSFVGQIRHYVGEFRNNQVGPKPQGVLADYASDTGVAQVAPEVVFNFDGFHGADVHHNTFLGMVDIKLHGHNHGDCFTCGVHNHANDTYDDAMHAGHGHGAAPAENPYGFQTWHSVRYSSLLFRDNTIEVPGGTALRYNDRNHAGDDRTANSEPNEHLDDPHVHYQDITIRGNTLDGGNLLVDVFNAEDERHATQNVGSFRILENDVTVRYAAPSASQPRVPLQIGIHILKADGLELRTDGNTVRFEQVGADQPGSTLLGALTTPPELQGIRLDTVEVSNLTLSHNTVESGTYGVFARSLTESVYWALQGNTFRTAEPWRGQDVSHPPEETQ